jgi:hypothetical protein
MAVNHVSSDLSALSRVGEKRQQRYWGADAERWERSEMGWGWAGWLARWEGEDPTIMPFAASGSQKPQLDLVEAARSHVRTSWKHEQEQDPICDRIVRRTSFLSDELGWDGRVVTPDHRRILCTCVVTKTSTSRFRD